MGRIIERSMINWNNIDTVFLDMDGTLLDLHYDNYFWLTHLPRRFAEIKAITEQDARETMHRMFRQLEGTLNWYCFDHWATTLDIDLISLKNEVKDKIAFRPSAEAFLNALQNQNYDVALVTNSHRAGVEIKMAETSLGSYIQEVVSSHDLGLPKEEPQFWQKLNAVRSYDPSRTLFIDDNESVLASAKQAGVEHLAFIAKPDSRRDARQHDEFFTVHDFQDIMPIEVADG